MWISDDGRKFNHPGWAQLYLSAVFILALAGATLFVGSKGFAAMLLYTIQEVKPQVFVWIPDDVIDQDSDPAYTRAGTAGFIVTPEGVVVVDTANSPMHARDLLYEIRRRTDLPIRYVINTSSAPDHMLGNEVFTDEQATLISTKAAQAEMQHYRQDLADRMHGEQGWRLQARMRGFHVTPSTQTFDDKMTLNLGGQEFRLTSVLDAAVVELPSAKTLFLGELYDNQYFPRIGSRNVNRWIEMLRQLEGRDIDTYVSGHGAPGSKKDLADFRKFLEWLLAQVEMHLKQGQTCDAIQRTLYLPKFYNWRARDLEADTVADVCRELAPDETIPAPAQPAAQ